MSIITEISEQLQKGKAKIVKQLVADAIEQGVAAKEILDNGLLGGMMVVGEKFKNNEVFVPEVLVAARAMNAGITILEPLLVDDAVEPAGKVIIATIKGDLHDIGKNLVAMMLKGAGFEVHDLGVDCEPVKFVDEAEAIGADVICVSALLTTTMPHMDDVIKELETRGIREKYVVMVGGAPVNQNFCDQIKADYYTADATSCAEMALKAIQARKN